MLGQTISHYRIVSKLGGGGMGVVYQATDTKLDRSVALKFLPPDLTRDPDAKERFVHEAKAASALQHHNICTIHEIDESDDGRLFIAMDCYEGETLKQKIARGPLPVDEATDIASQVAEGLSKAHDAGMIHRDIKPANIMITSDNVVKIVDFGLAKLAGQTRVTKAGMAVGTVPYMSPEQAQGDGVDHRTDIWSLGVVLYEMLTGQLPFKGDIDVAVVYSILHEEPRSVREQRPEIPKELEKFINRALSKDPNSRFSSATHFLNDLKKVSRKSFFQTIRQPKIAVPAIIAIAVLGFISFRLYDRSSKIRWARHTALPEVVRLKDQQDFVGAFRLIKQAERYIPDDPQLRSLLLGVSITISVQTDPSGADVYYKDYSTPDARWEHIGQTPIDSVCIPHGYLRWEFSKEGFETKEVANPMYWMTGVLSQTLDPEGSGPAGMVRVNKGKFVFGPAWWPDFWIGKYEVTNREYQKFVDAGGYQKPEYWKPAFVRNGRTLSWEEALDEFRDATGRPGPSTWELGTYPEGKADHPVCGVSWYEAAAYAEYVGGSLPVLNHWRGAAGLGSGFSDILPLSNFGGEGPAAVGKHQGLSTYGSFDMAGNVKEWCWDQVGQQRYISGGAWNEPDYMFFDRDARSPYERLATFGFRCAVYDTIPSEYSATPINDTGQDFSTAEPVAQDIFDVYGSMYAYDPTDLNSEIESVDESSAYWRKETVTFDAAYGDERVIAQLYLPRNALPPYQTVIYFPTGAGYFLRSSENLHEMAFMDFVPRSGRAFLIPVYKGFFERRLKSYDGWGPIAWRDMTIQWVKDVGRSIDYLETRQDIDGEKIAYIGFSSGGIYGPIFTALEERFKVSVLITGGFILTGIKPEMDPINFAPRSSTPTLMVNGENDFLFPLETSQKPLFRLLGTPAKHKRHAILEGGHIPEWNDVIKETLDWLDRYLGPVSLPESSGKEAL
jgi:serine/threonine protein kinase